MIRFVCRQCGKPRDIPAEEGFCHCTCHADEPSDNVVSPVLPLLDFGGNGFDPGSNGSGGGDGGFGGFGGGDFGGGAGDNF